MQVFSKGWKMILNNKFKVILLVVILTVGYTFLPKDSNTNDVVFDILPIVTVSSVASLSGEQELSVIGAVRAFSEAIITAETAARVVSVNATLGQTVPAGFVVATLENASQRAAVLQAEGVYEAAIAASAQSSVGVDEAKTNLVSSQNAAVNTLKNTYTTINGTFRNEIDSFFGNPEAKVPGLKIAGKNQTQFMNNERVAFQTILADWKVESNTIDTNSDLVLTLTETRERVNRTITLVDVFLALFNDEDQDQSYTKAELLGFSTSFTALRSSLQTTVNNINNSISGLESAADSLRRAEIGATGNQSSASDAQIKQALGSLRAAQANLAKTILRTPISGTVNSIDARAGEFVSNQEVVARIAKNNALEIITFVGDSELNALQQGSSVVIEDKFEGTVTQIAPAVDALTRKTEIRIAVESEEIQNGDTVTIKKSYTKENTGNTIVTIPLSAVKFEIENGFIFVVENGKLVSKPVSLGAIRGGGIEVTEGLSLTDEFVLDARGLLAGAEVEIRTK